MLLRDALERGPSATPYTISAWFVLCVVACSADGDTSPAQVIAGSAPSVCALGQAPCSGLCTNLESDARNCGQCGKTCGNGSCIGGQCVCPSTLTACASGCSDTTNDLLNCGSCGRACAAGEACQQGQCLPPGAICTPACIGGQLCVNNVCKCPESSLLCAGTCLDTNTTPAHCGKCDAACGPGQLCQAGKCVCPVGQMMCDAQCSDLQLSPKHCGMCGHACGEGEACMAGSCRAPLGADGCGGESRDLQIQEVAAFQAIKIPLSKGVTLIDPAMRTALVQNKSALFRVYVTAGAGFSAREFSARVTIKNGANEDQYFAKQRISKASTDADTASTFQITVPRERIQADTRYAVEVVECAAASTSGGASPAAVAAAGSGSGPVAGGAAPVAGSAAPPAGAPGTRFPAQGDTPLAARDTGTLRITIVPLVANSRMPDTSDAMMAVYRDYLEAMYPVDKVVMTVAKPQNVSYPVNWNGVLEQLRAQRQRDQLPPEEYYYGMLHPTDTFAEFCRRGCTAGIAYIGNIRQTATRVALGVAYGDELSAGVMAHEVGHNHGRAHAPCAPGNQIQSVDPRYPYQRAGSGVWAYDIRSKKFLDPASTKDIMGYCDPKWISGYTYKALLERSPMINPQMLSFADPATIQAYRVLLLDEQGPRWSIPFPRPEEPFGTPEVADVLDIDNQPIERVTVYRTEIGDSHGFTILVPEPRAGWNAIKLNDALPLPFSAPVAIPELR